MTEEMKRALCMRYTEVRETIKVEEERAEECRKARNAEGLVRHIDNRTFWEGAAKGLTIAAQALGMHFAYNTEREAYELNEIAR